MAQNAGRQAALADQDDISLTSTESEQYGSDAEFTVDRILAEKGPTKNKYYLISWEGYPEEKSTWEPQANVGSDTLEEWAERLAREKRGLDEPFDVAKFEATVQRLRDEKEDRHKRREAKRRRLKMARLEAIAAKRRKQLAKDDSDSSSEAIEENEVENAPGIKIKTAAKYRQAGSKQQLKRPIKNGTTKPSQRDSDSSSDEVPLAKQKSHARPKLSSANSSATQQSEKLDGLQSTGPSLSASRSSTKNVPPYGTRGGKGATRGGSNVFQSRDRAKGERSLLKSAMDPTRKPRTFNNMHQRYVAEKQGRSLADRAPDIEQTGGLFDPSKPLQPIDPTILRRSTKKQVDSEQPESELFVPAHSPVAQEPEAIPAPPYQYSRPTPSRQVCFFWHRKQQNSLEPGCVNKYDCSRYHHYEPGAKISPQPPNYVLLDTKSTYSGPDVCWFWHRKQVDSKNHACSNGDSCPRLHEYREGAKIVPPPGFVHPSELTLQSSEQEPHDLPTAVDDDDWSHHDKPDILPSWQEPVAPRPRVSVSTQDPNLAGQHSSKPDTLPPWEDPAAAAVGSEWRPYRATCFFWDLAQKNPSHHCRYGSACKNLHSHEPGIPVAPPPSGWVDKNAPKGFPTASDTTTTDRPQERLQSAKRTTDTSNDTSSPDMGNMKAKQPSGSSIRPSWDPFRPTNAICHFWSERSFCTKGHSCPYSHDVSDMGLPVAPSITDQQKIRRQTPCRDWDNGHCSKSDCPFVHKPRTLKNSTTPAEDRATHSIAIEEAMPLTDEPEVIKPTNGEFGDRYFRDLPATDLLGSLIQPLQRKVPASSTSAKSSLSIRKGEPENQSMRVRPPPQPKRRAWSPRDSTNAICHFYFMGNCKKPNCEYIHSTDPTLPVAPHLSDIDARTTCPLWAERKCPKSDEECPYLHETTNFVPSHARSSDQGSYNDSTGTFRPGQPAVQEDTPTAPRSKSVRFADHTLSADANRNAPANSMPSCDNSFFSREGGSRTVCKYFQTGDCKYGRSCRNVHEDPSRSSRSDRDMDHEMLVAPYGESTGSNAAPLPLNRLDRDEKTQSEAVASHVDPDIDMLRHEVTRLDVEQLASNPIQSTAQAKRKKVVSMDDYKKQKAVANVGERAKKLVFGYDAIQAAFFDFGEVEIGHDEPWKQEFLSTKQLVFNQLCMAQDLESQQGSLHGKALKHGSLQPADSNNPAMLKFIEHVAEELTLRIGGLVATCENFAILIYPSKREEWSFLEQPNAIEARLHYMIFKHDFQPGSQHLPANLEFGEPYRTLLADKIQGTRVKNLLPLVPKEKSPFKFFMMFPSSEKQMVQYLSAWILASNAESQIYDSLSEGSWDFFLKNAAGFGVVFIHESLAPSLDKLPFLSRLLKQAGIVIWNVSDSTSLYPLFPSNLLAEDAHVGRLRFTRLFPHGCAFLLTPSFIIAEPNRSYEILTWFLNKKFGTVTPGTWKLVCCHDFRGYLLDLANSKAKEKEDFELEHKDKPAKDSMLHQKKLDFGHCETRYKLYTALATWHSKQTGDDYDSDADRHDNNENPLIQAPQSIDQDDDEGLINWFAGWGMLKLDMFRKFAVIGTNSANVALATRMKEVKVSKPDSATTITTTARADQIPSTAALQKQKALEIANRLAAADPRKVSSEMEFDAKADDSDVSMDLEEPSLGSRPPSDELDARQYSDILKLSAQTGYGPEDAKRLLARANGDLTRALDLHSNFESSFNELLHSAANPTGQPAPPLGGESAASRTTRSVDGMPQYEVGGGSSRDASGRASLVMSPEEMSVESNEGRFQPVQAPQPQTDINMDGYANLDAEPEVEMETVSIRKTFNATSAWYRERQAKGMGWEHISVFTKWEEAKQYLGIK